VLEVAIIETQKQHVGVEVTQSLGASIITIGVEKIDAPNINVVRRGVLIGFVAKLGGGVSGVSIVRNSSRSLALLTTIIGVVGIPQMVFTNLIITLSCE
jgi:hypothetical protein